MKNITEVYNKVVEMVDEVPFGNSDFQNRLVIVDEEKTPARAYRHAALRVMNRLEALKEAYYSIRKREIEIKILERDREGEKDDLKRQLIDLDIEQKRSGDAYVQKMVKDAVREIESLWPVIASIGKLSREQFEKEEVEHYQLKHGQTIELEGDLYSTIQSRMIEHKTTVPANFLNLLRDLGALGTSGPGSSK